MKTVEKFDDKNPWRFVEKFYPRYASSDQICHAGDLQKLMDEEVDGCAEELLNDEFEGDIHNPEILREYNSVHVEVYEDAIEGFIERFNEMADLVNALVNQKDRDYQEERLNKLVALMNEMEC